MGNTDSGAPADDLGGVTIYRAAITDTRMLEERLDAAGIAFTVEEVGMASQGERQRYRELRQSTGFKTLPLIFVNGDFVGGEPEMVELLADKYGAPAAAAATVPAATEEPIEGPAAAQVGADPFAVEEPTEARLSEEAKALPASTPTTDAVATLQAAIGKHAGEATARTLPAGTETTTASSMTPPEAPLGEEASTDGDAPPVATGTIAPVATAVTETPSDDEAPASTPHASADSAAEQLTQHRGIMALLGYTGAIPFLATAWLAASGGPYGELALTALIAYGAVILSFVGAVHWGLAVARPGTSPGALVMSVVPALAAWPTLFALPGQPALALYVQSALLTLWYLYEVLACRRLLPRSYRGLRLHLTVVVALTLAVSARLLQMGMTGN